MQQAGRHKQIAARDNVANIDRIVGRGFDLAIVSLCVVIGLILRLDFMRASGFTIDADEAIVGLMGRDILLGRGVPVFYYGQHYMGSLEAVMASVSFALFGVSPFSLQLVPLLWSLVLIVLAYGLGRAIAGSRAGLIAASLMAVAPPALLVWSSKARGGFIEVVVLGAVALWITIEWIRNHPERLRYPSALGLVLGIGWWVNNQIIYFIVPIALFSVIHAFSRSMRLGAPQIVHGTTFRIWRGVAAIACVGFLSFLLGGLPYWYYNIGLGFPSAGMFKFASWEQFTDHLEGLRMTALPAIVGAQRFWQRLPVFPFSRHIAIALYVLPTAVLMLSRWRQILGLFKGQIDRRSPIELLVFFCISCCLVFSVSSFGWLVQAPRYLLPLYIGLYPLIAVCCDRLWRRSQALGVAYLVALLAFQVASSYYGGRGLSGEPVVFGGQRVARDHSTLIEKLERLGISRIRANYWIGYRLAFETEERITFTVLGEPTQARIPRYEENDLDKRALLPMVLVQSEAVVVEPALKRFGFSFKAERVGDYSIVYDIKSESPPAEPLNLKSVGYTAKASGANLAGNALDGDVGTRWGTGSPQSPGQSFEIELSKPQEIVGVRYFYGAWFNDRAVELKVEVEDSAGVRTVVLSQRESPGAMHISARDPYFTLRFAPVLAHKMILTQLGRHAVLDWSIAEIQIMTLKGESDAE